MRLVFRKVGKIVVSASRFSHKLSHHIKPLLRLFWRNKMIIISAFNVIITISLMIVVLIKLRGNVSAIALGIIDQIDWLLIVILFCLSGFAWQSYRLFKLAKNEKWDKLKANKLRYRLAGLSIYCVVIILAARYILSFY